MTAESKAARARFANAERRMGWSQWCIRSWSAVYDGAGLRSARDTRPRFGSASPSANHAPNENIAVPITSITPCLRPFLHAFEGKPGMTSGEKRASSESSGADSRRLRTLASCPVHNAVEEFGVSTVRPACGGDRGPGIITHGGRALLRALWSKSFMVEAR